MVRMKTRPYHRTTWGTMNSNSKGEESKMATTPHKVEMGTGMTRMRTPMMTCTPGWSGRIPPCPAFCVGSVFFSFVFFNIIIALPPPHFAWMRGFFALFVFN